MHNASTAPVRYINCPTPGVTLEGAHVTHIPGHLPAADIPRTFQGMRDAGIMCPTCGGNGQILVEG